MDIKDTINLQLNSKSSNELAPKLSHKYRLGHSVWWSIFAGALAGLLLRFFFNMPAGKSYSAMQGSFIYGAPILSAAISTWLSGPKRRLSAFSCVNIGGASACLVVLGALMILIEGWICAIIIFPVFLLIGMVTGFVMWILYSLINEVRARQAVYSFAVIPLMFGSIELHVAPPPYEFHETVQTVFINASPELVWKNVTHTKPIETKFFERSYSSMIGVPAPVEADTELLSNGKWVRHMKWDKGVHFYGDVSEFQPNKKLAWKYRFEENSFPKGALDEHVTLAGEHFELIDGNYLLTAKDGGTYLTETTHWRISTQFNAYSRFLGNVLINDTVSHLINIMKIRSEKEI